MKKSAWLLALLLSAVPVFAQDAEESALRELGVFGIYSIGNLALRDIQRGNEPVQQLKRFFSEARQPLSSEQEKQLSAVVDNAIKALQAAGENEEGSRRINAEYMKKVNDVLTVDQRAELRRYRTEQIMMRGGFPALKLILDSAQTPFTDDQEKEVRAVYVDLNRQVDQLTKDAKGSPDRLQLSKLEGEQLGKVVRLLTPAQRRALVASRQGKFTARVQP
jgi:hypothetical protein